MSCSFEFSPTYGQIIEIQVWRSFIIHKATEVAGMQVTTITIVDISTACIACRMFHNTAGATIQAFIIVELQ